MTKHIIHPCLPVLQLNTCSIASLLVSLTFTLPIVLMMAGPPTPDFTSRCQMDKAIIILLPPSTSVEEASMISHMMSPSRSISSLLPGPALPLSFPTGMELELSSQLDIVNLASNNPITLLFDATLQQNDAQRHWQILRRHCHC